MGIPWDPWDSQYILISEKHYKLQPKPKTTDELKAALQTTWEELPQEHINKAVVNFIKR